MKVQNNTIFMGDDIRSAGHGERGRAKNNQRKSINGSSLNAQFDPIAAKKQEARKMAMKIVGDAFKGEKKIDDDLNARREKVKALQQDKGEANKAIKEIEDGRSELRDAYRVDKNSQEEQDLKLLEKEVRSKMPGSDIVMTFDEMKKVKEIKANGLTEYQQRSIEMLESETSYVATAYEDKREIITENQIISATEIERLKNHTMADSQKQADAIMDAASQEIIGMLTQEMRDHMDEVAEEAKEKAEAKKEKEEELQEKLDAAKEREKEREKLTERILEEMSEYTSITADVGAAKQEIQDMMSKMSLIEDDIKGAAVDKSL